jgi:hypothetical protein
VNIALMGIEPQSYSPITSYLLADLTRFIRANIVRRKRRRKYRWVDYAVSMGENYIFKIVVEKPKK